MTCENMPPELLAFHLGAIDPASRGEVESHLLVCPACLRSYLALKRSLEEDDGTPAPSAAARERLRRAVVEELAVTRSTRWRWWERPLAFGLAATAALVALSAVRTVSSGPGAAPRTLGQPAAEPVEHRG